MKKLIAETYSEFVNEIKVKFPKKGTKIMVIRKVKTSKGEVTKEFVAMVVGSHVGSKGEVLDVKDEKGKSQYVYHTDKITIIK